MTRFLILVSILTFSTNVLALTTKQLVDACKSNGRPCHELPFAHAYVGGSLDLMGALIDQNKLKVTLSCASTKDLFDTTRILEYIETHHQSYLEDNAMTLVIKFVEEQGCATH